MAELPPAEMAALRAEVAEEIARALEARAERTRQEAFTPASGIALGAIWDEAAIVARSFGSEG